MECILHYFADCSEHIKQPWMDLVLNTYLDSSSLPPSIHRLLCLDGAQEFDKIKGLIARHPETPSIVLEAILPGATDPVLARIAEHPNCSRRVLEKLAEHRCSDVRMAVCDNANAPLSAHWSLARDSASDVRYRLAEAFHVVDAVLEQLIEDENPYVSCRAQTTLSRKRQEREA